MTRHEITAEEKPLGEKVSTLDKTPARDQVNPESKQEHKHNKIPPPTEKRSQKRPPHPEQDTRPRQTRSHSHQAKEGTTAHM